jgi:hypothetical protein
MPEGSSLGKRKAMESKAESLEGVAASGGALEESVGAPITAVPEVTAPVAAATATVAPAPPAAVAARAPPAVREYVCGANLWGAVFTHLFVYSEQMSEEKAFLKAEAMESKVSTGSPLTPKDCGELVSFALSFPTSVRMQLKISAVMSVSLMLGQTACARKLLAAGAVPALCGVFEHRHSYPRDEGQVLWMACWALDFLLDIGGNSAVTALRGIPGIVSKLRAASPAVRGASFVPDFPEQLLEKLGESL